jgi:hypothetical protein
LGLLWLCLAGTSPPVIVQMWLDAECALNYTVVRPAGLTNGATTGNEFKVITSLFS